MKTPDQEGTAMARCPQLNDDVKIELRLPPTTDHAADSILAATDEMEGFEVERTDDALIVRTTIGGNCTGVVCARQFLSDVDDYLEGSDIDPMEFTLTVTAVAR